MKAVGKLAEKSFTFWLVLFSNLLAVYMPANVDAQDNSLRFQRISTKDGLSNNIVYTILQDSKGYLWAGTYSGLDRYDGYSFTHFQHDPTEKSSIVNGPVYVLFEDSKKNIWVGTTTGKVCRFDPRTENFTPLPEFENNKNPKNFGISSIKEDKTGNLWIATYGLGLFKYNLNNDKLTSVTPKNSTGLVHVTAIYPDDDNNLWIGTYAQGFLFFDTKKDSIYTIFSETNNLAYNISVQVQCINKLDDNRLLLGSRNGWAVFNKKDRNIKKYNFKPALKAYEKNIGVSSITEDKKGIFWLTTNSGLFSFNIHTGAFKNYINNSSDYYSLSSNASRKVIIDISNNLWVATEDGINKLDAHRGNFINYYSTPLKKLSQTKNGIRAIYQDKENITWLGAEGGLARIKNNTKKTFNQDVKFSDEYYNNINTIYEGKSGRLWIGSPKGLQYFNRSTNKINTILYPRQNCWSPFATWAILEDSDSIVWFGTQRRGLFSMNTRTGVFNEYSQGKNNIKSAEAIWSIFQDSKKNIWFGTNKGIYRLKKSVNTSESSFEKIGIGQTDEQKLHGENVWWFHEDKQKNIWIATSDGGLNKFDTHTGTFKHYTTDHGLPSNTLSAILEDKHGKLWISTINGLCKFDPETGRAIRNYHIEDGLQGNHFNFKSAWQNPKGEMFFGEQQGFIKFHPDSVAFNSTEPNITISSFKVLYNEAKKQLLADSSIILPYHQNSFSFDFASLDLTNPGKNKFSYILEGFDDKYINAGTRHFVSYTNLDPGKYVFKLKGTNSDGLWNSKDVAFRITILPPFWQTWWFRSIIAFIFFGFTGISLNLFYKRNIEKRRRVQSELSALRNQLNPHFVFNSLTSLQHFIIENQRNLALDYLSKFAVLMRMILENSKQETISLEAEKQFLELYLYMEAARFEHKFGIKIIIDDSLNPKNTNIPPMLLQPVVENAIKHGLIAKKEDGKIEVSFIKKNKNSILCIVEDNGVGRNKAMEAKAKSNISYQSMSTEIIAEKLNLINKKRNINSKLSYTDLYDADGQPLGTRAEIELPLTIS